MNIYFAQDNPELFKEVKETIENNLKNTNVMSCSIEMVKNGETKIDSSCVLMIDMDLPGKNTLEMLNEVKGRTNAPIVVMDDINNGPGRMVRALHLGAVDYVYKPIHPSRLISTVIIHLKEEKRVL